LNLSSLSATTEPYSVASQSSPSSTSGRHNGDIIASQWLLASTPSSDIGDVVTNQLQTASTPSRDASDIIASQLLPASTPATARDTVSSQFPAVLSTPVSSDISTLPAVGTVTSHSPAEDEQLKEVYCTTPSLHLIHYLFGNEYFFNNLK